MVHPRFEHAPVCAWNRRDSPAVVSLLVVLVVEKVDDVLVLMLLTSWTLEAVDPARRTQETKANNDSD